MNIICSKAGEKEIGGELKATQQRRKRYKKCISKSHICNFIFSSDIDCNKSPSLKLHFMFSAKEKCPTNALMF